jgi:hypothetical protein
LGIRKWKFENGKWKVGSGKWLTHFDKS